MARLWARLPRHDFRTQQAGEREREQSGHGRHGAQNADPARRSHSLPLPLSSLCLSLPKWHMAAAAATAADSAAPAAAHLGLRQHSSRGRPINAPSADFCTATVIVREKEGARLRRDSSFLGVNSFHKAN